MYIDLYMSSFVKIDLDLCFIIEIFNNKLLRCFLFVFDSCGYKLGINIKSLEV